jgi:hypothetical protein
MHNYHPTAGAATINCTATSNALHCCIESSRFKVLIKLWKWIVSVEPQGGGAGILQGLSHVKPQAQLRPASSNSDSYASTAP